MGQSPGCDQLSYHALCSLLPPFGHWSGGGWVQPALARPLVSVVGLFGRGLRETSTGRSSRSHSPPQVSLGLGDRTLGPLSCAEELHDAIVAWGASHPGNIFNRDGPSGAAQAPPLPTASEAGGGVVVSAAGAQEGGRKCKLPNPGKKQQERMWALESMETRVQVSAERGGRHTQDQPSHHLQVAGHWEGDANSSHTPEALALFLTV